MHHGYRPGSLSSLRAVGVCPMSLNCSFKLTARLSLGFPGCFHPPKYHRLWLCTRGLPGGQHETCAEARERVC